MSYMIYRVNKDETKTIVACVDDLDEVGVEIDEDRKKFDQEVAYLVESDTQR